MLIGRKQELEALEDIYVSDTSEFVILYGKRRVGKTELLTTFAKDKQAIFYSAKVCTDYEQLGAFSEVVLGKGQRFASWQSLFEYLAKISVDNKQLVIIDEFPYMVQANESIQSELQNIWDHTLKKSNIKLIICGSSMSFIEKKVISEKNPLFGRLTSIMRLYPLKFEEIGEFFPYYSTDDLVVVYSILGGVPHYLLQFDAEISVADNIKKYILNKRAILYHEVDFSIREELRQPMVYYSIIEQIAYGATKYSEIQSKTQIATNKLSVYLNNLLSLGIIEREFSVTEKTKAKVKRSSGLYRIKSNYFAFYFRFVFPNISELEQGDIDDVYSYDIEPFLASYSSFVYERLCYPVLKKHIQNQTKMRFKDIGRWWQKNAEIDIVGMAGQTMAFAECKWQAKKVGMDIYNKLLDKAECHFDTDKKYYYLFSKSGFTDELIDVAKTHHALYLFQVFDEV